MATPAPTPVLPAPKPPASNAKYYLIHSNDGTSELVPATGKKEFCRTFGWQRHRFDRVDKLSYAELTNSVTQRVYDFQFYFANFIQTPNVGSPQYRQALANLMDLFSDKLYLYVIKNPDGTPIFGPATTKEEVRDIQALLHDVFHGFTLQTAPNVRVRPVCGSTTAQASTSSGSVDYSLLFKGISPGPLEFLDVGFYNITWTYDADNVWRIVTSELSNKLDTIITPETVTPVPYVPYPDNPPSNCTPNS